VKDRTHALLGIVSSSAFTVLKGEANKCSPRIDAAFCTANITLASGGRGRIPPIFDLAARNTQYRSSDCLEINSTPRDAPKWTRTKKTLAAEM
jgi:hypothetical protein